MIKYTCQPASPTEALACLKPENFLPLAFSLQTPPKHNTHIYLIADGTPCIKIGGFPAYVCYIGECVAGSLYQLGDEYPPLTTLTNIEIL